MKYDLTMLTPLLNSAGSLGFAPDARNMTDISRLGAFITNPISIQARSPMAGTRFLTFPGGFLLNTGYPNPGLNKVIRTFASHWKRSPLPIWVHLLAERSDQVIEMVKRLEIVSGVGAIELGIHPAADEHTTREMVTAAVGELPLIVRLPLERAVSLALALRELPIAALSLAPPYGALPDAEKSIINGRLYGPSIFPLALKVLQELIVTGIPIIAAGGVTSSQHIDTMLSAGAIAVQLDSVLWCRKIPEVTSPSPND
jgi:dihydroorotate dehydrogenase (NAD+) catalytic subunit